MKWFEPSSFDWAEGPPLSSFRSVATASAAYVALVILSTQASRSLLPVSREKKNDNVDVDRDRDDKYANKKAKTTGLQWRPWFGSDLKTAQFAHNVVLVASSAAMLGGVAVESARRISSEGAGAWPPFLLCEGVDGGKAASGSLYYWSYVYYLSKYYELLDTALQLARGKPPPHFVLHVYHHATVLIMAWAWVDTKQSLHFIGLAFNTAVHVVMYSYFLQRTITRKVPRWKSFVTLFQIIQFSFSLVAFLVTLFIVFVQGHECSGMTSLYLNVVYNITLLHSFVGVFLLGRKKHSKDKK